MVYGAYVGIPCSLLIYLRCRSLHLSHIKPASDLNIFTPGSSISTNHFILANSYFTHPHTVPKPVVRNVPLLCIAAAWEFLRNPPLAVILGTQ